MLRARLLTAVFAVVAVLAGLLGMSPMAPSYAAQPAPTASPSPPIIGESFKLYGALSTRVARPVQLQRLSSGRFVTIKKSRTTTRGRYTFTGLKISSRQTFRVVAPVASVNGRRYGALTTANRRVTPVAQRASLQVLPQISQKGAPGPAANQDAAADSALTVLNAVFSPARSGRAVVFQRLSSGTWANVASTRQNARGIAVFRGPAKVGGVVAEYRAVTVARLGAPSIATASGRTDAWGAPDLTTEFGPLSLGQELPAKWTFRKLGAYEASSNRKCSASSKSAVKVADGMLRLSVIRDPARLGQTCTTTVNGRSYTFPYYLNGHVSTEADFTFKYGVAAARVRMNRKDGQHGSFWLQQAGAGDGAEIDVMEFFGEDVDREGVIWQFIHKPGLDRIGGPMPAAQKLLASGEDWWNTFHVFSVEWTPTQYIFRIDGVETFRTSKGLSSVSEFPILSLLSSDWELPRRTGSEPDEHLYVDWVRVWQK